MRILEALRRLWARLRNADAVDWLFSALSLAVGMLIIVVIYALADEGPTEWAAISYPQAALIVAEDGTVPRAMNTELPIPSINEGDAIPARLTRVMDCATYVCPEGGIPTIVNVRWQSLTADGTSGLNFNQLEDFPVNLLAGSDYELGARGAYTAQLTPFGFPTEAAAYASAIGADVTAWRIEGTVEALVPGALPVSWSTEVFHVDHSGEGS